MLEVKSVRVKGAKGIPTRRGYSYIRVIVNRNGVIGLIVE